MAMAMATTSLCPSSSSTTTTSTSSSLFSQFPSNLRDEFSVNELSRRRNANRVVGKAIRSAIIHKDEGDLRTSFDANALDVPVHTVTVHDRTTGSVHKVQVPEDQYILHTAEYQDVNLPFSCRHGCCTACAVRVKSGEIYQPRALGISPELKEQGYALLCVGYPLSDLEVETQDEDEVYWLQFGQYFAGGPVERDDYALELAVADE